MNKKLLFVSGTPRSGTSALVNLLNSHPLVMVGMERYKWLYKSHCIDPSFFEQDRFLDVREGDTNPKAGFRKQDPENLIHSYESAEIIGDKSPLLYSHFGHILPTFPDAKHVFIIRDPISVAESYQKRFENPDDPFKVDFKKSVNHWNKGVTAMMSLPANIRQNFLIVEYESIFKTDAEIMRLFSFLGLSLPPRQHIERQRRKANDLEMEKSRVQGRDDIREYVSQNAKWDLCKELISSFHG